MNTPAKIIATPKETIIAFVKRAVDNATLNCRVQETSFDGIRALVYPQDDMKSLITFFNEERLFRQYPALRNFKK